MNTNNSLPSNEGTPDPSLAKKMEQLWLENAAKAGVDVSGFDPNGPLTARILWASNLGLQIGVLYTRFSTKLQSSTEDQARPCFIHAAHSDTYIPKEYWCADEAVKGSKRFRAGLKRLEQILTFEHVKAAIFFKLSRLYRQSHSAIRFIREQIVEAGKRAIVVSQGIDTADKKSWRLQVGMHTMMDEELLIAIADHVREGLAGLFLKGWTVGALPVGYVAQEVPGAPVTRRKLPRTMPVVDEPTAKLIRLAFNHVADGMSISEAWRRYREAGGPADPRSTTGKMSYEAFHRLLRRAAYIGVWRFGKKRNEWSSARDSMVQKDTTEEDVRVVRSDDLRIVTDEMFFKVQRRLDGLKTGPRGPRRIHDAKLWQLVTDLFHCPHCVRRMHTCGAKGTMVRCPNPDCPARGMVDREKAVEAILDVLTKLIARDTELVVTTIEKAQARDQHGDENLLGEIADVEKRIVALKRRIDDLFDMAGQGNDEDRANTKTRLRDAQNERGILQAQLGKLKATLDGSLASLTTEDARKRLSELSKLLQDGASGKLGRDAIHKAVELFKELVGHRIDVYVESVPKRARTVVRGVFKPDLLNVVTGKPTVEPSPPVTLWLRPPPRIDAIAAIVAYFYEQRRLGFRRITKLFNDAGVDLGCGNTYSSFLRHYELMDRPPPPRRPRGRGPSNDEV